ncbi:hypothetical protein ACWPKS_14220 [Coraliomargarita sp. W4R72]
MDTTSDSSAWVRPLEDINGFSITAFDPQQRAISFQWKNKTGILFLGNSSADANAFNPQMTLSEAKILFTETTHNRGSSTGQRNLKNTQSSINSANKSFGSGKEVAPRMNRADIIQAAASEDSSVYPTASRNHITPNRVNSRVHASDHIRDVLKKANQN